MTGLLVFKMEFYKFFKNKRHLILLGVLSILNTFLSIRLFKAIESSVYLNSNLDAGLSMSILILYFSVLISFVLLITFPFQALSEDYTNSVMVLMMASGVDRRDLYFSKILATLICSFINLMVTIIIPVTVLVLAIGGIDAFRETIDILLNMELFFNVKGYLIIIYLLVSNISSVVSIFLAVILTKGGRFSAFVWLGILFASTFIKEIFIGGSYYGNNQYITFEIIFTLVLIVVYSFISLWRLKTQNL